MASIGCISLIVMYKLLNTIDNKKIKTFGLIFFAITPWHIMKSRWGLESNVFPDIILYAIYFIIKFVKNKKIVNMYIAGILLGFSAYAYGTSYFFLPIFVIFTLTYMLYKKQISIKHCIGIIFTIFLISLPIILFLIINTFHLKQIKFLFTIPILQENRYEEITSIFSKNFIKLSIKNFKESILILIKQYDNLRWNALPIYGLTYIISLPFTILGIYCNFKTKDTAKWIMNFWFITSFILLFIVEPNINRVNIIMIPIIYYTILGMVEFMNKIKITKVILPIILCILFINFEIKYFSTDWNKFITFNGNLENVMNYVDNIDTEKIYFEYSFKEPFIYVCFYNKINTKEFINTVQYKDNIKAFDSVESFGKYNFYIPKKLEDNAIYVLKSGHESDYDFKENEWKKEYIDKFIILSK